MVTVAIIGELKILILLKQNTKQNKTILKNQRK